jgi:tetrahydromethanopterin S-methyltransferase subunit A
MMTTKYYPWGGEFTIGDPHGCVAVVLLSLDYTPPDTTAIYGSLRTENIGIEKIVANIISNPNIRFLIICGNEIRGHRSGASLISLHENGIDKTHRIIDAPGAIPYIENLDLKAIQRFQKQITIINQIDMTDSRKLDIIIKKYIMKKPASFGEPYIAIQIIPDKHITLEDKRALHSTIMIDYMGRIKKRGK